MIKPVKCSKEVKINLVDRKAVYSDEVECAVKEILSAVREEGDETVKRYTLKFDKSLPDSFLVSKDEIDEAMKEVSPEYIETLKRCIANIEEFHKAQLREGFEIKRGDCVLGQKFTPVESAGLYIPGGTAAYPSTVLMNSIPAKIAGVQRIVMVSPPQGDGKIKKEVIAAAVLSGVTEIYKVGGAQAIGALAYGTKSIPKVDCVVGPGNIYVAVAKKQIYGTAGIDMVAGPSEILVIADGEAIPRNVAADLLSQAEHDALASAILLTDSEKLATEVSKELESQVEKLERRDIAQKSLEQNSKIIICASLDEAAALSDEFAPEHLELCVKDPFALLKKIKNAGSVFLGYNTPEAVGDYFAGANHTLPTGGTAKFASPLSVDVFLKATQYMYYTKEALVDAAPDIVRFAESEGLTAHAKSIKVRTDE